MLGWWTIGKATGVGVVAGLIAFLLWPFFAAWHEILFWPFVAVLVLAAFSGVSILFISLVDVILHHRGQSIRPVRLFDVIVGFALVVPALAELRSLF